VPSRGHEHGHPCFEVARQNGGHIEYVIHAG
jgi:hypothetical protein